MNDLNVEKFAPNLIHKLIYNNLYLGSKLLNRKIWGITAQTNFITLGAVEVPKIPWQLGMVVQDWVPGL